MDKINFFPFVHGDQIEQHRENINSQMRDDYRNYLSSKERDLISNKSTIVSKTILSDRDLPIEARSTQSTLFSRSRKIKHIFDSEYVKPEENFRVYQESHPKRSAVLKDALDRFEAQLQNDKGTHNNNMYLHKMRIQHDENEL